MDIPLRRSDRTCRPVISYYYIVYLQEHEYDVGDVSNPTTYKEAIISLQSNFWIDAMKDEMTSISVELGRFARWLQTYWVQMGVQDQAQCQRIGREQSMRRY